MLGVLAGRGRISTSAMRTRLRELEQGMPAILTPPEPETYTDRGGDGGSGDDDPEPETALIPHRRPLSLLIGQGAVAN